MKSIFFIIILFISNISFAQLSIEKLNTYIIYTSKKEYFEPINYTFKSYSFIGKMSFEYNKYFESGLFFGKTIYNINEQFSTPYSKYKTSYNFLGINHSFLILPIFNIENNRIKLYLPINIGVSYLKFPNNIIKNSKSFLYSFGIGSFMNILKKMSIFFECELNNRVNIKTPYLQFGISYNWGKPKNE